MPKDTKTLGNNKARACESLGFVHKKRLCQRFDTTSSGAKAHSWSRPAVRFRPGRLTIHVLPLWTIFSKNHKLVYYKHRSIYKKAKILSNNAVRPYLKRLFYQLVNSLRDIMYHKLAL